MWGRCRTGVAAVAGEDESGVGARDICVWGTWGAYGSRISDVENLMNIDDFHAHC